MTDNNIIRLLIITLLILSAAAAGAQSTDLLKKAAREKVPVVITARQAEFDNQNRKVSYRGDVKVVRGDATMYADNLDAYFKEDGKELDHIEAAGNIKVTQEDRLLTSQKGIYYEDEQKIVLTGDPVSREGENVVEGSKMIYFFTREKVLVENAKSVLHPNKAKQEKEPSRPEGGPQN